MTFQAFLSTIVFASLVFTTIQDRDELVLDDKTYLISQLPMAGYWHREGEPRIGRVKLPKFQFVRSSNWKGYSATWSLEHGKLVLKSLEGKIAGKEVKNEQIIDKTFPIHATWYSGKVFLAVGGYDSNLGKCRYVIEFQIKSGDLIETKFHDTLAIPSTWNGAEDADLRDRADSPAK